VPSDPEVLDVAAVEVVVKRPVLPLKIPTGAVKRAFAANWIW
jgi:hypothetical protein